MELIDPKTSPLYASELDLRYRVLREPLGMGRERITFAGEEGALHLVSLDEQRVVGCVLFDFASGRLRAMAIDPARQRTGLGSALVVRLEQELATRGVREVKLHARAEAVGFYARLGYAPLGAPFDEIGIPHVTMTKAL